MSVGPSRTFDEEVLLWPRSISPRLPTQFAGQPEIGDPGKAILIWNSFFSSVPPLAIFSYLAPGLGRIIGWSA
jgi:hypothetical protein